MIARPGSLLWLAGFELKLLRRDLARLRPVVGWLLLGLFLGMHVIAWMILRPARTGELPDVVFAISFAIAFAFVFVLMSAKALTSCVHALHGRRDLDLLLGSPLPASRIIAVRLMVVSLGVALPFLYLLGPFIDALAAMGAPHLLAAYPVTLAFALVATLVGFVMALLLTRLVGPRRAETAAQIVGAIFGAGVFLVVQSRVLLPDAWIEAATRWMSAQAEAVAYRGAEPLWLWPGWAAVGAPGELAAVLGFTVMLFAIGVGALAPAAARWARASFGAPSPRLSKPRAGGRTLRPRPGPMRALLAKELRLLARNPLTIFHTLMKSLYLTPLALLALVSDDAGVGHAALAALVTAITLQLGSALAGAAMRGEQAADLMAGAPVSARAARAVKLAAVLGPVGAIAVAASLAVASRDLRAGLIALVLSLIAAAVAGQLALWTEEPPRRTDLRRRDSDLSAMSFIEVALTICFGGICYFAIRGDVWALAPAAAAAALFIAIAPRRRAREPKTA